MATIQWKNQQAINQEKEFNQEEQKQREAFNQFMTYTLDKAIQEGELTEEQKAVFLDAYEPWRPGQTLNTGDKVRHQGNVYEVIQPHTTQSDWLPDTVPALYKVFAQKETTDPGSGEPVEVIPDWKQPTGAHDAYKKGDKAAFNGKVYESTMDGNIWSPTAHPAGWKEVTPS